ncbi:MAG TPA: hypothetical protein VLZ30_04600 [Verrucomicrobiae bacterium]|nr:hypothetical protein [Verrucomicrobiae bacterium]
MKRSVIDITVAISFLVAIVVGAVRADPLPGEILKFQQLPLNNTVGTGAQFPGHDELSTAYLSPTGGSYTGTYMADDFADNFSTPIVHVRWWGSYLTNYYGSGVTQFLIVFETDVASNAVGNAQGYSHPGTVIVSQIVNKGALAPGSGTFVETPVPIGPGPANPDGNLYQYNAELAIPVPEMSNQVAWIKIVALTTDPQLMWGWHDRDYSIHDLLASTPPAVAPGESNIDSSGPPVWHFQDDAVTGAITIQGTNVLQTGYTPTFYNTQYDGTTFSKDLAFELYTTTPQPPPCEALKFYQAPLNNGALVLPVGGTLTPGSVPTPFPGHDEVSTAYYNADGNFYSGTYMADDFCDFLLTPILHVTWWGSYMNSGYYGGGVQQFLITVETDVASNSPNNTLGFSHPGTVNISQIVNKGALSAFSGTFTEAPIPIGPAGPPNPDGNLYQYEAELATPVPEYSNEVQWIKIVALTTDQNLVWGWHDRDYGIQDPFACVAPSVTPGEFKGSPSGPPVWHFQDDAVTGGVVIYPGTNVQQSTYAPTFYLPPYDGINSSKDLAFALYTIVYPLTFDQWQLKYFGCTNCPQAAASADPDADGMSNTNEFLADTDPTHSLSAFRVVSIVRQGPDTNDVNIVWTARPCKSYIVQVFPGNPPEGIYSNSFVDIAGSLTVTPSIGGGDIITNYVDVGGATNRPSRYYRVRLVP